MHYKYNLPHSLALFLLQDTNSKQAVVAHFLQVLQAVTEAEAAEDNDPNLAECLKDLAWNIESLPRQVMHYCLNNEVTHDDVTLRTLARRLYGATSSTKENLESCFNFMSRQVHYMHTNLKLNRDLRWYLATLNPYNPQVGANQPLPTESDWWKAWQSPAGRAALQDNLTKLYDVESTPLPQTLADDPNDTSEAKAFPKPSAISQMQWRPAGGPATQRSCAAAAFLRDHHDSEWSQASDAWAGLCVATVAVGPVLPDPAPKQVHIGT